MNVIPKPKWNLNTIYISERLQECLRPLSRCTLTAVVVPMGYGKTTAINWYLPERTKVEVLYIIHIGVYFENLAIFWKSMQNTFVRAGSNFLRDCTCPMDVVGGGLLVDELCYELVGETSCYISVDDLHFLTDRRISTFFYMLVNRASSNVHLTVASRDRFLPAAEAVRLGAKVCQIGTGQLHFNHTELAIYAHRCGIELSEVQVKSLLYSSEGWFSAVYLNLRTFSEHGVLPNRNSGIYATFTTAMIGPPPEKQREFLMVMGFADEFTVEIARSVTGDADAEERLSALTAQNAFVICILDGMTYRFHHVMKECAERTSLMLSQEKQARYRERLGLWHERHRRYLHAIAIYRKCKNYDVLPRVICSDVGILLASLKLEAVLRALDKHPAGTPKAYPFATLVLMRRMLTWRQIPKMLELKALSLTAIEGHPELLEEERGNLLGECDLITNFLCYNDISTMSRLHRSAGSRIPCPAINAQKSGGWTFGFPSVLMMYYRTSGALQNEFVKMDEYVSHYHKVTGGYGQGAEIIMRAEALFCQGRLADARIELEGVCTQIEGNGRVNMALCCDFLAWRLSLCMDAEQRYSFEERCMELLRQHNTTWVNIWSATGAYYHALLDEIERTPSVFAGHQLSNINFLAPGEPMMEMIENQAYLAQGVYTKVIGCSIGQLTVCEAMYYALVTLHIRIQTVAVYEMFSKWTEAQEVPERTPRDAESDGPLMPFVENYRYLKNLLESCGEHSTFVKRIMQPGEDYEVRRKQIQDQAARPATLALLTEWEYEIVGLIVERLSNREIAEKLSLSEGSIKQYINQVYQKLHIEGDTRTKRKQFTGLLSQSI